MREKEAADKANKELMQAEKRALEESVLEKDHKLASKKVLEEQVRVRKARAGREEKRCCMSSSSPIISCYC